MDKPDEGRSEEVEYLAVTHPDYATIEMRWLGRQWVTQRTRYSDTMLADFHADEKAITEHLRQGDDAAVFDAIRLLGTFALWGIGGLGEELPALVKGRIEFWYNNARPGALQGLRRAAVNNLRHLGEALAGEQRGRQRGRAADPVQVWDYYHALLFRFRRARKLLPIWPWRQRNREKTAHDVAVACGLQPAAFLQAIPLSGRSLRVEQCARIETAKVFRVTQHTVSNLISKALREPWSLSHRMPRVLIVLDQLGQPGANPLIAITSSGRSGKPPRRTRHQG